MNMKIKIAVFILINLFLLGKVSAGEAKIAVAANFTKTIEELGHAFEKQSDHKLKFAFGPTGKLYAQIRHGAPFDAFFAADKQRPLRLLKEGAAVESSYAIYAQGQLALFSFKLPVAEQPIQVLQQAEFRYLALANPKTAPYGASAELFLKQHGLYKRLKAKLVRGESVGNAFQYVATKNAEIGFVALSQILDPQSPLYNKGQFWVVPAEQVPLIEQAAVVTKRGENNLAVKAFMEFIRTEQATTILERYGYVAGSNK